MLRANLMCSKPKSDNCAIEQTSKIKSRTEAVKFDAIFCLGWQLTRLYFFFHVTLSHFGSKQLGVVPPACRKSSSLTWLVICMYIQVVCIFKSHLVSYLNVQVVCILEYHWKLFADIRIDSSRPCHHTLAVSCHVYCVTCHPFNWCSDGFAGHGQQ